MNHPGYYAYVQGECSPQEYANLPEETKTKFYHLMYDSITTSGQFYRVGIERYFNQLNARFPTFHRYERRNLRRGFIYFYNRQLIVQLTFKPIPFGKIKISNPDVSKPSSPPISPDRQSVSTRSTRSRTTTRSNRSVAEKNTISNKPIYVPIYKAAGEELQADYFQLTPHQVRANGGKFAHLLVIVDPFSRFVWAFPSQNRTAQNTFKVFEMAMNRPGLAAKFYHFLRDKVKRITVDGGSEFKEYFADHIRDLFPNGDLYVADAKSKTHGRPTTTGPVEAAIRSVRRVLRDQEVSGEPAFFSQNQKGLSQALDSYNSTVQTHTHLGHSPIEVVHEIMGDTEKLKTISLVTENRRQKKIQELNQQQRGLKSAFDWNSQIPAPQTFPERVRHSSPERMEVQHPVEQETQMESGEESEKEVKFSVSGGRFGYRLKINPKQFAKEVDLKVSLEAYTITRKSPTKVDLREIGGKKEIKDVLFSQLVLIKLPIEDGPPQIKLNFEKIRDKSMFHAVTKRDATQPYTVTPRIMETVGAPPLPPNPNIPGPVVRPVQGAGFQLAFPEQRVFHDPVAPAAAAPISVPDSGEPVRRSSRVPVRNSRYADFVMY